MYFYPSGMERTHNISTFINVLIFLNDEYYG